jgi:hypothetical protein
MIALPAKENRTNNHHRLFFSIWCPVENIGVMPLRGGAVLTASAHETPH